MRFNNALEKAIEKTSPKIESKSEGKNLIYNRLAEELCSESPNKAKIKKLCSEGQILYSGDMVDLMSTVLFELSEVKKYRIK